MPEVLVQGAYLNEKCIFIAGNSIIFTKYSYLVSHFLLNLLKKCRYLTGRKDLEKA
jgi:hypothetical protein